MIIMAVLARAVTRIPRTLMSVMAIVDSAAQP